jgi:hypothetical protein
MTDPPDQPPILIDNETFTTLFPASLFECLRDRLAPDLPAKHSIILQGLGHTGEAATNIFTLENIFDRLHLHGITLDSDDIQTGSDTIDAVRMQTADNGRACGVLGSNNKGISLSLNLAQPDTAGESMNDAARYPTSLHFTMLINKRDGPKRIYDIPVRFSVTFQTTPRRDDMWNKAIQSKDILDPNWRLLFTATWLHKDLDILCNSLIIDFDHLFRYVLSDIEYQFLIQNLIVIPVKPYFVDDNGPNNALHGGGIAYHLHTDLDDPIQMTTRRKVLHHLMGTHTSPMGNGLIHGVGIVYYQPTSDDQPLLLNTAMIRKELLSPKVWLVRFSNLPACISPYHMLIILLEGYHFNPPDILNIFMDHEQLNDNQINLADRMRPSMLLLLAAPEVLRTFLVHSTLILDDLQDTYQNSSAIRQALADDPTLRITLSSPHKHSTTLPRLPSDGLYRHLTPLLLSALDIDQRATAQHDPTNGLASQRAPWATPPSLKHRQPFTSATPVHRPAHTSRNSERPRTSSSLFRSPSSSSSSSTRSESPKRARDGSLVTQVQSMLTLSPPTTPLSQTPPTHSSTASSLQYTLQSLRQRAFDDQSGITGRDILLWAHAMAKTLRDATMLPDADIWRLVGPSHDNLTPPENTMIPPMYNIPLPTPAISSNGHEGNPPTPTTTAHDGTPPPPGLQLTSNPFPLAPRPPLPPAHIHTPSPTGVTTGLAHVSELPPSSTATPYTTHPPDFHQVDANMDTTEMEEGEVEEDF